MQGEDVLKKNATNEELCLAWQQDRDPRVRDLLVQRNLPFVKKAAGAFKRPNLYDDLVQEGCLGLLRAFDKWDSAKGIKVMTYASWWIKAYQKHYFIPNRCIVAYGTTMAQRKIYSHFSSVRAKLDASGLGATPENIAKLLGLDIKKDRVEESVNRLAANDCAFDKETWHLKTDAATAEDKVVELQLLALLRAEISIYRRQLKPRDRHIFDKRLIDEDTVKLQDLADQYGISRERTRQIEQRTLRGLKKRMLAKHG